jgi:peptide/nickel transport system substrate-binding protein
MKTKPWKLLIVLLALTLLTPLLAACDSDDKEPTTAKQEEPQEPVVEPTQEPVQEPAEEPVPSEPVTLRIGTTYIWDTANPTYGWYNYALRYLLYDTLIEETKLATPEPGLAESWEVSDDGLVWTFKIREGVTFHDGTPCTAEDVAWSLNWTIENEVETISFYLNNFAEVVALDPTTLQVTLAEQVGNMEYLLIYVWIFPRSVWEGMSYDDIMEFEDLAAGMGTGPYKLVEWVEGEYLILEANENYWRGAPAIDRVIYQEYAEEDLMVQALLAGELDLIGVPSTAIQTLQGTENIELAIMQTAEIDELIINSHEEGSQPESLNDPAVRLAIAHAIDKEQIVNVAYLGYAEQATTVVAKGLSDWQNSDIVDIPFDLDAGNRILEEAGYVDSDGDGVREDSDGNPLEYRLYAEDAATHVRILEIISDGLADIGISAPPTAMDEDSLIALYPDFDFDLIYWGWALGSDPDFVMLIFTCDERGEGGWNDSGYCDEEFDEMYFAQTVAGSHEERRQLLWDMQEKLFEERPYIVLTYPLNVQAYNSERFTGFSQESGSVLWKWAFLQGEPVP